jgi:hypothetical protein
MGRPLHPVEVPPNGAIRDLLQFFGDVTDKKLKKVGQQLPVAGHAFQGFIHGQKRFGRHGGSPSSAE